MLRAGSSVSSSFGNSPVVVPARIFSWWENAAATYYVLNILVVSAKQSKLCCCVAWLFHDVFKVGSRKNDLVLNCTNKTLHFWEDVSFYYSTTGRKSIDTFIFQGDSGHRVPFLSIWLLVMRWNREWHIGRFDNFSSVSLRSRFTIALWMGESSMIIFPQKVY